MYEPDRKHRKPIAENFGLNENFRKLVPNRRKDEEKKNEGELWNEEKTSFRAVAARLNYLAADCPHVHCQAYDRGIQEAHEGGLTFTFQGGGAVQVQVSRRRSEAEYFHGQRLGGKHKTEDVHKWRGHHAGQPLPQDVPQVRDESRPGQ